MSCSAHILPVEASAGSPEKDGFLFARWQMEDWATGLSRVFRVYAAPQDLQGDGLRDVMNQVAALSFWHGHFGAAYASDEDLLMRMKDGSYNGSWVIPPRMLLDGTDMNYCTVFKDHLLACHEREGLAATFAGAASDPRPYISSTLHENSKSFVWATYLHDRNHEWKKGDSCWLPCEGQAVQCRLIRFEEETLADISRERSACYKEGTTAAVKVLPKMRLVQKSARK